MELDIEPIGYVSGGRAEPIDDDWGSNRSVITLDKESFDKDAFAIPL